MNFEKGQRLVNLVTMRYRLSYNRNIMKPVCVAERNFFSSRLIYFASALMLM